MSLFVHADPSPQATVEAVSVDRCMFCAGTLKVLHSKERTTRIPEFGISKGPGWERWHEIVKRCRRCGWWCRKEENTSQILDHTETGVGQSISGAAGCLKALDISYGETPIQEIRDYLTGKYDQRFAIRPRVFEEVVASVFRDLGYQAIVTNYSGDDGVDVFLTKGSETIGVQVKRYEPTIGVDQIRELAGSLLLNDVTKGMFVTTSGFQRGAAATAQAFAMRGWPIELVDADRFFSALELAQFKHYKQDKTDILGLSRARSIVLRHEYSRV